MATSRSRSRRRTLKKNLPSWPPKYYSGLSPQQTRRRRKEIKHFSKLHWKDPRAYTGFKTDKYAKTKKKSGYTAEWNRLYPDAKSLEERSKVTGVPVKYLDNVFRRGSAAWRTGHRPGMSQEAWAYPRVSSFLLCGKAHYTADSDLVRKAKKESQKARKWFRRCKTSKLTK
jgi:hypothetical protein